LNEKRTDEAQSPHDVFLEGIENLIQIQDLLLVKLLITNFPVIEIEYGSPQALAAIKEIETSFESLNSVAYVARVSQVLFELRARDSSNQLGFIRQVKSIVNDVNSSKRYRFLLEVSLGAVVTDHKANLSAKDWDARLNLALMKSTRTGRPEIADVKVATSEQVRHELSRLGPGSPPSPTIGSVSPEIFIQIAEELNLVQIIDFWTLKAVESSYAELLSNGGQAISINISAQTLGNDHEFFTAVDLLLPKIKEAHFSLIFELTETSVIENQIDLSLGLIGLRKRGAKIAIDDFGTGKTSLSIISSLPTDFVKLDGSLLEVERPDLSRGLLELGVKFAELVGAEVIVEKVETQEDLELARQVGAKYAQGWLFGQPVDLSTPTPTQI